MTDYKCILTILLLTLLLSCRQRGQETSSGTEKDIDTTIVLVNYKKADRAKIARGIQTINKCHPKIIGVNALFIEPQDAGGDSLLAKAIREAKNVILTSNGNFDRIHTTADSLISSNSIFVRSCLAEGLVHYGFQNQLLTSHSPFQSVSGNLVWSFPLTIAGYYDMTRMTGFMNNFAGSTYFKIHFHKNINNFRVLDIDKLDEATCDQLESKIILMGYLGPTREDLFNISSTDYKQMYSTVVIANIILNLLNNEPIEGDDEVEQEKIPPTIAMSYCFIN